MPLQVLYMPLLSDNMPENPPKITIEYWISRYLTVDELEMPLENI